MKTKTSIERILFSPGFFLALVRNATDRSVNVLTSLKKVRLSLTDSKLSRATAAFIGFKLCAFPKDTAGENGFESYFKHSNSLL